jgi:hypothetical protein
MIKRLLTLTFFLACSETLLAERYVVSEDAFGNTSAESYRQESSEKTAELGNTEPVIPRPESLNQIVDSVSQSDAPSKLTETINPIVTVGVDSLQLEQATTTSNDARVQELAQENELNSPVVPDVSSATAEAVDPFEQAYKASEAQETDPIIKRLRANVGGNAYDATAINEADFVDSEDLLQGNVNEDGERPFYMTMNPDGEQDVIFYSPSVMRKAIKEREYKEQLSTATIFRADKAALVAVPKRADPTALRILQGGLEKKQSFFEQFSQTCCGNLPTIELLDLSEDARVFDELNKNDTSYRFVDGTSRYALAKLPNRDQNYLIVVKTFVRNFKEFGIEHGVFIPQVVFLDENMSPTRVASDIVMQSFSETWTSYGYLKAVLEVEQTAAMRERFILLYTNKDQLRRRSQVQNEEGLWDIEHMDVGSLEVSLVHDFESALK